MTLPEAFDSLLFLKLPCKSNLRDYPESYYELADSCGVDVEVIAESKGGSKVDINTDVWLSREIVESICAIRGAEVPGQSYIDLHTGESICVLVETDQLVHYVEDFILLEFEDEDEPITPVKKPKKTPVKNEKTKK